MNLLSTVIGFFVTLLSNSLLPKSLGPKFYGDFGFVISIYESILYFFKTGIHQAYFNYNSKKENSYYINKWMVLYYFFITFFLLSFTFYSLRINSSLIWNSYQLDIVLLILFLVLTKESQVLFDGYGHAKSLLLFQFKN